MKGGRTESGLMDREIGMAGAFSDEGNKKAGVFAISRDEEIIYGEQKFKF